MSNAFQNYVAGLFAALAATIIAYTLWGMDVAYWVSFLAPTLVIGGVLVHIVCFDSRKRWPDKSLTERLTAVLSFER